MKLEKDKNMFKKTLIAGGMVAVMSSGAQAVPTFAFTENTQSIQGFASATLLQAPAVTVTLGAEYATDDLMTLSYNADFDTSVPFVNPSNISAYVKCNGSTGDELTGTAADNGGVVTLGVLSTTANSVTYRVTAIDYTPTGDSDGDATVDADECSTSLSSTVGGVFSHQGTFSGASLRAQGALTGSYSATLSNGSTAIDGGSVAISKAGPVTEIISFANQYASVAANNVVWNGVIDVAPAGGEATRTVFNNGDDVDGSGAVDADERGSDQLTIDVTETARTNDADTETITAVISGDFSWVVDETAGGAVNTDAFSATVNGQAVASVTVTATDVTVVGAASEVGDVVLTLDNLENGNDLGGVGAGTVPAMAAGAYTATVTIAYTDEGTDLADAGATAGSLTLAAAVTAGTTTLNGSTSTIEAYPVSDAITGFLWVTNAGTNSAGMSVTAVAGGSTMASCDIGTVAGNTLSYITNEVETCLTAAGITSGRAQVTVTVNAPAADINVYAGYKVDADADRLSLTVN